MPETAEILHKIRCERGYTLSYHEIYARLEPELLEAYGELYRTVTLRRRVLEESEREFLWVALLTSIAELVGSIHINRGVEAGLTCEQLEAAIRLAGIAEVYECLAFPSRHWASRLPKYNPLAQYDELARFAAGGISEELVQLTLLTVQAAHRREEPFLHHLQCCYGLAVPEAQIAEALSYVLQPIGANGLLWATDLWLDALQSGDLKSGALGDITVATRRS